MRTGSCIEVVGAYIASGYPVHGKHSPSLLRWTLLFGKLDHISPAVTEAALLTNEQIESHIRSLVSLKAGAYINTKSFDKALESWGIKTIDDPEARVIT